MIQFSQGRNEIQNALYILSFGFKILLFLSYKVTAYYTYGNNKKICHLHKHFEKLITFFQIVFCAVQMIYGYCTLLQFFLYKKKALQVKAFQRGWWIMCSESCRFFGGNCQYSAIREGQISLRQVIQVNPFCISHNFPDTDSGAHLAFTFLHLTAKIFSSFYLQLLLFVYYIFLHVPCSEGKLDTYNKAGLLTR